MKQDKNDVKPERKYQNEHTHTKKQKQKQNKE